MSRSDSGRELIESMDTDEDKKVDSKQSNVLDSLSKCQRRLIVIVINCQIVHHFLCSRRDSGDDPQEFGFALPRSMPICRHNWLILFVYD
jgi:hypothetical protein